MAVLAAVAAVAPRGTAAPDLPGATAQTSGIPKARFVFFHPDASGLPPADILAGLENYATYLRARGVVDLSTHYFRRATDLEGFLQRLRDRGEPMPWFSSFSVMYMLQRGYKDGYDPIVCAEIEGLTANRYSVIVRRSSPIKTLDDTRGAVIALTDIGTDVVEWNNVLVFQNQLDMKKHFASMMETDSPMSSVMAVIFKQADVAIVFKLLFDRLSGTSQQVWQKVRPIYSSRPISFGSIQAWRGAPAEVVDKFRDTITGDLRNQTGGKDILDAFYIDGFRRCTWGDYDAREGEYLKGAGIELVWGAAREAAILAGARRGSRP